LTYLRMHFMFIDKIWINKDRYDRKRLFRKAGQGKANESCDSVTLTPFLTDWLIDSSMLGSKREIALSYFFKTVLSSVLLTLPS